MNLVPIYNLLRSKVSGEAVYMYNMPENVTRGIEILHNLNGAMLDQEMWGYRKGKFQTIVREKNFQSGYSLAKQVMDALKVSRVTQGSTYIHFITPLHDPVAFPKSAGDFIEFSINYETAYSES